MSSRLLARLDAWLRRAAADAEPEPVEAPSGPSRILPKAPQEPRAELWVIVLLLLAASARSGSSPC